MAAEQLQTDQKPIVQGLNDQAPEVQGRSVSEQPPFAPRVSMKEVRELNSAGIKVKEEMAPFIVEVQTTRDQAKNKPPTLDTMRTVLADAERLGAKALKLKEPFKRYRASVKEMLGQAEVQLASTAVANDLDKAKQVDLVNEKSIKICRQVYQATRVVHKAMLETVRDLCGDGMAICQAVVQKEKAERQERQRRMHRMMLRVMNTAGF